MQFFWWYVAPRPTLVNPPPISNRSLGISNSNPPLLLYIGRPPLKEGGVRVIAHFRLRVSPYRPPSAADPLLKKRGVRDIGGGSSY